MRAVGIACGIMLGAAFGILCFAGVVWSIVLVQNGLDAL
jgi:hypothetical protein